MTNNSQQLNTRRTCKQGHHFFKSSNCPTCPVCEDAKKPITSFRALLAAPARRALENAGIESLEQLSELTEKDILNLHGVGKTSIPLLKNELKKVGLYLKR